MMRFSLKWLLVAVAFVAVGLVALLNASDLWRHLFETATILLFLTSVVGAVVSSRQRQAFWIGYAVFAAGWLVVAMELFSFSREWATRLITTDALNAVHAFVISPTNEVFSKSQINPMIARANSLGVRPEKLPNGSYRLVFFQPSKAKFTRVGNAVLRIPFGLLGSVIAGAFYRRRATAAPAPPLSGSTG